jgi:hypothetical protein
MFGRSFFGGRFFAAEYFGVGGTGGGGGGTIINTMARILSLGRLLTR